MSKRQKTWAPQSESPLDWLWQHYRIGELVPGDTQLWPEPHLKVEIFPEISPVPRAGVKLQVLPQPWEFVPEHTPYSFTYPSQAAAAELDKEFRADEGPDGELANLVARARGEVTHRLLQTWSQDEGFPGEGGVAAALVGLGVPRETAQNLAPEILDEVRACLQDRFLMGLLVSESSVSEWLLENQPASGVIRRGRLDLLAFDGREWWLVDFKTSRPPSGGNLEDFLLKEAEKYRPQLLAYREMTAGAKGISPPEAIRLALYFTAIRKVVEV